MWGSASETAFITAPIGLTKYDRENTYPFAVEGQVVFIPREATELQAPEIVGAHIR